jgi:hypothetical protein
MFLWNPSWLSADYTVSHRRIQNTSYSPLWEPQVQTGYLFIYLLFHLWLYSPWGPWPLFSFLIYTQSVGLLGRGMRPSQGRYLYTEQHKHRINAHRHPYLKVGFEPTIPVFERARTVHALDCAATVIGVQTGYLTDFRGLFKVNLYVIFSWRRGRQINKFFHGQLVVTLHSLFGSSPCALLLRIRATTKWRQTYSLLV